MKKNSHSAPSKKLSPPTRAAKIIQPLDDAPVTDVPPDESEIAADRFEVANAGEEAASTGHRIEPVVEDDEHNAEKLVEEGLHGYLRASPNHPHKGR